MLSGLTISEPWRRQRAAVYALFFCFSAGVVHAEETPKPSVPAAVAAPASSGGAANTAHSSEAVAAVKTNEAPRCDADCVRANMDRAAQACARRIEAEAPIDFEWINRPFGAIFQEADPSSAQNSIVVYRGDTIRFLSPQNEWIRVAYQCAFDVAARRVADLRIRPGRLGRPQEGQANGKSLSFSPAIDQKSGAAAARPQIESAKLASAIQQALQRRQATQQGAKAPAPKPPQIGEVSDIEITQMAPNRR